MASTDQPDVGQSPALQPPLPPDPSPHPDAPDVPDHPRALPTWPPKSAHNCPKCGQKAKYRHCRKCPWLFCVPCQVTWHPKLGTWIERADEAVGARAVEVGRDEVAEAAREIEQEGGQS